MGSREHGVRGALLPLAVLPVLVGAGPTAHACWTTSGYGTPSVGSSPSAPLVVTAAAAPSGALHPGASSDVGLTLSNPNGYAVRLTTLTGLTVRSDTSSCPGVTHLVPPAAVTAALASGGHVLPDPVLVPPGTGTATAVLADLVTLSTAAPDACQGVLFTIDLAFTGAEA